MPGLAAKPILDIDVVVASDDGLLLAIKGLATIGYIHRGNLGIEGREAFSATVNDPRHHLYACREDSPALRDHLTFRDHLRTHPETAEAYAILKRVLIEEVRNGEWGIRGNALTTADVRALAAGKK